jgi:tRNA(fMet)-specific endonuclease VapC
MKKALIDTNIISAFMRGDTAVIHKTEKYLRFHRTLSVSVITYYELIRGLKALSNINKLNAFKKFMSSCEILDLDSLTAEKAAEIYDALKKKGTLIAHPPGQCPAPNLPATQMSYLEEDADILIAATAIKNELVVITDNTRHFDRSKWGQTPINTN